MDEETTIKESSQSIMGFGVSGFRTLQDVELVTRGPLTVICGPNNTGKSSLLQSLQIYPTLIAQAKGEKLQNSRDQVTNAFSGEELFKVAVDVESETFVALLKESKVSTKPQKLASALQEQLDGPLWLHFSFQGGSRNGWQFDKQKSLDELNEAISFVVAINGGFERSQKELGLIGYANLYTSGPFQSSFLVSVIKTCLVIPEVRHIPDIRRAADKPLEDKELLRLSQANARRTDGVTRIEDWATTLELILKDVFGNDVRYEVRPEPKPGDFRLRIDGEDDIKLGNVGAGVREVVAIAYAALSNESATVLAIEEPENCLHPTAVRRLVKALPERAEVQLFVSTHSSAVVNANPGAILHLSRKGDETTGRLVNGEPDRYEAVRSLGYSPADLVLTPCALWVEGPSDRCYLVHWLHLVGLEEGIHYQVMYYGGSLASHVSTSADTHPSPPRAEIRNLARRCAIIADRDIDKKGAHLKKHVKRFKEELKDDEHALLVMTWGREIENDLPLDTINTVRENHGEKPITASDHKYERVVNKRLANYPGKMKCAEEALTLFGNEIPPKAKGYIRKLEGFIRESA